MNTGIPAARVGDTNRPSSLTSTATTGTPARRDAERDPVADRTQPDDDDVVVDAARDRPAAERLEQPRADERVGDERVDDRHDGGPDEAQEDGVDAQRGVAGRASSMSAGSEAPVSSVIGERDRIERRQAGHELEEDRRADGEDDQDRPEPQEPLLRRREPVADRRGPGFGATPSADVARVGRGDRPRLGPSRSAVDPTSTTMRFGSVGSASGSSSTDRSACSRAMAIDGGSLGGSADSRDVRSRPASRKLVPDSPSMAAETKPGAASADDDRATASGNSSGICEPSSWSNIRMTTRIVGWCCTAASAVFRLARSSSPVRTMTAAVSTSAWLRIRD